MLFRNVAVLILLMGLAVCSHAESARSLPDPFALQIAPVPAWVRPITPPTKLDSGLENNGTIYLLVDTQDNLDQNAFYYHEALEITSENGTQSNGSISASFNPRFEKLTFHFVRVVRGNNSSNRLDRSHSNISTIEKNADRSAYNPGLKVEILLDDVRSGDIIEYAYTKEGANPLTRGKYAWIYSGQWASPVIQNSLCLLVSANRSIKVKPSNDVDQPRITTTHGVSEILYEATAVPGRLIEDDVPNGYAPRRRLEVSEFKNWAELKQWAGPLFDVTGHGPEFSAEVSKLRSISDDEQRIVAALQFVQDEIRSTDVASFSGDHALTSPDTIVHRRFGDYADKVGLLVALLRSCPVAPDSRARLSTA